MSKAAKDIRRTASSSANVHRVNHSEGDSRMCERCVCASEQLKQTTGEDNNTTAQLYKMNRSKQSRPHALCAHVQFCIQFEQTKEGRLKRKRPHSESCLGEKAELIRGYQHF